MNQQLKKIDLTGKTIYVGIDVHKKTWHFTTIHGDSKKSKSIESDAQQLYTYLSNRYPNATFKACYEAGCFGFKIKEDLDRLGIETIVINPADIPTTDKEKRTKTDPVDSAKLAMHLKNGSIRGIYAPSKEQQEDRALFRHREFLVRQIVRNKNKIKSILAFNGIKVPTELSGASQQWSNAFINWLKKVKFKTGVGDFVFEDLIDHLEGLLERKKKTTKRISRLLKEKHREQSELLSTVPGLGPIAIASILVEGFGVERFKHRDQYLSYIGLIPTEHSSGESRKIGHLIKRFNRNLRKTFIECAWVAVREDPALTEYYENCCLRMKKTQAIVKVARKLATRSRYVLKNNQSYVKGVVA